MARLALFISDATLAGVLENFLQPYHAAASITRTDDLVRHDLVLCDTENAQKIPAGTPTLTCGSPPLTLPLRLGALLDEIAALLRAVELTETLYWNDCRLERGKKLLCATGRALELTDKETILLVHLFRAGEKPCTREELLGAVWGYGEKIDTHTLETHIYRLRKKLADGGWPIMIAGGADGYRLADA